MAFKGVSPLIAVVMLIAFTLVVAGILGGLVTQFVGEQRQTIEYCTGARVLILSGIHQAATGGNSDVTLSIHNFGNVDLNFTVLQTQSSGTVSKRPESIVVKANDVGQLRLAGVSLSGTREFTIQSLECAGAQDSIRIQDLKAA